MGEAKAQGVMNKETVADLFLKDLWTNAKHKNKDTAEMRLKMMQANRFVLNDACSSFYADLGMSGFQYKLRVSEDTKGVNIDRFEHIRSLARLPHKLMWYEWNNRIRLAREYELGACIGGNKKPILGEVQRVKPEDWLDEIVQRAGLLLEQHPEQDTAFRALYVAYDPDAKRYKERTYGLPFWFQWTTDDSPLAWPTLMAGNKWPVGEYDGEFITVPALLSGLRTYEDGNIGLCAFNNYVEPYPFMKVLQEFMGELRYIFAFLATVNDVHYEFEPVKSNRVFRVGGSLKKGLDHSMVYLNLPNRKRALPMEKYARSIFLNIRKRAHMVRGHWRHFDDDSR